jgi:formylglycine-generating enzyme required for sulfatase activity
MWPATGFEEIAERAIERNRLLLASLAHANPWLCVDQLVRYPSRYARQFLMADVVPTVRTELLARTVSDDVRERVLALDGLGSLSDLGLMGQRDLPHSEFELVEIPGRVWELAQPVPGDAVEEPRVLSVQLPRFDICRTPVSNPQFRSFVDDGGYFRQELWSAIGWQWREGRYPPHRMVDYWNDRQAHLPGERELIELLANGSISAMEAAGIHRFSKLTWDEVEVLVTRSISATIGGPAFWASDSDLAGPVRPVVGVSWYEACAYCEWLSRELDARVRLPTEWEWQAAAIFTRLGPNGSHRLADAEEAGPGPHTNTADLGLGSTNPIGSLSPDGEPLVDLHGNVFEWCIDPYGPVGGDRYVMKGGSWRRLPDRSTIRYRGQGHASLRNDDVGLRVVVE